MRSYVTKAALREFNPDFALALVPLCTPRMSTVLHDIANSLGDKYEILLSGHYLYIKEKGTYRSRPK